MQQFSHLTNSLAYIDGGSASLIFQAIIGGALAGAFFLTTKARMLAEMVKSALHKPQTPAK